MLGSPIGLILAYRYQQNQLTSSIVSSSKTNQLITNSSYNMVYHLSKGRLFHLEIHK